MTTGNLTIQDNDTVDQYTSVGEAVFGFNFPILETDELKVSVNQVLLTYGTDYTIDGLGDAGGGEVDLTLFGGTDAGDIVTLWQDMPIERLTGFSAGAATLLPEALNDEFAGRLRVEQQLRREIRNALRLSPDDPVGGQDMLLGNRDARVGRFLAFDSSGRPTFSTGTGADAGLREDLAEGTGVLGDNLVAKRRRAWEISQGVTITDYSREVIDIDVQRYGILPNNPALATANTAALRDLLDPLIAAGTQGRIIFPPVIGGDTYHLNDYIECRDHVTLDLLGCRLLWTKTAAAADQTMGLLSVKTGVTVMNGTLEADITGTVGGNACILYRVGSRPGSRWGQYTGGIFDKDDLLDNDLEPMGDCRFVRVKFKSNNPYANTSAIGQGLGGLRDVVHDGCIWEGIGAGGPGTGFYYEMGTSTDNGQPSQVGAWGNSHATNLYFRNCRGMNLNTVGVSSDDAIISLTEPNDFIIDGLYGENVNNLLASRYGEGHYIDSLENTAGPRIGVARGVRGFNIVTSAAIISGSGTAVGQYSDANRIAAGLPILTLQQKLDLMQFDFADFDARIDATGYAIISNAPFSLNRSVFRGGNGIFLQGDCSWFDIANVWVLDSLANGIRADSDSTLLPGRQKRGRIANCKIAGSNAIAAISLNYCDGVIVENNQLGYMQSRGDAADEATQTFGVNAGSDATNIICRNNAVATDGTVAYTMGSHGGDDESAGNAIVNPIGNKTYSGKWRGVQQTKTVTFSFATPGDLAITYTQQTFAYERSVEGDRVDFSLRIETSAFTHTTAVGAAAISGLPFTVSAANYGRCSCAVAFQGITKANYTQVMLETNPGATTAQLSASGSGQALAVLGVADFPTGGNLILRAAGHYFI